MADDHKENDKRNHKSRALSEEDQALWVEMTRDVTPLADKEQRIVEGEKSVANKVKKKIKSKAPSDVAVKSGKKTVRGRDVDAATLRRLKRGNIRPEASLDLHGMNQGEARQALMHFILSAYASGQRCVCVVTGKGNSGRSAGDWLSPKAGVLKRNVPGWLNEGDIGDVVLKAVPAQSRHGGDGALYVLLRRKRT